MNAKVLKLLTGEVEGPNFYKYLGLEKYATEEEIEKAYENISESIDISRATSFEIREQLKHILRNLNKAHSILITSKNEIDKKLLKEEKEALINIKTGNVNDEIADKLVKSLNNYLYEYDIMLPDIAKEKEEGICPKEAISSDEKEEIKELIKDVLKDYDIKSNKEDKGSIKYYPIENGKLLEEETCDLNKKTPNDGIKVFTFKRGR